MRGALQSAPLTQHTRQVIQNPRALVYIMLGTRRVPVHALGEMRWTRTMGYSFGYISYSQAAFGGFLYVRDTSTTRDGRGRCLGPGFWSCSCSTCPAGYIRAVGDLKEQWALRIR